MNNAVYGKAIEKLRNRIDPRLVSNEKDYLEWTSKLSYMSQKIFDDDLVAIHESKVTLTLNKSAYIGLCVLDFIMITLKKYSTSSRLLSTDTDSLMHEIKKENVYEDFSKGKEMFDFSNYSLKSKYDDDSNRLAVDKMKDETAGVAIEEIAGLKIKMYPFLVDYSSEHKEAKGVNKNVVTTVSHNECKLTLLIKKCLRLSMNRIQSKNHRIETCEINKISLSCFDDKIHILNNGYDE